MGKIDAHVLYDREVITLKPLQVSYLGGVIDANASIDTKGETPRLTSSGKITKLPVGRILGELGVPRIVTGSLTTNFDISGSGKSADAILKSLSGNISASIWDGILGTNLLDLSGMNLVTWLATKSDILIFDEPTRGIDVGAKQEMYHLMIDIVKNGKSIIMISSELPELLGMSDRIAVMHRGKINRIVNKEEANQELLLELASGVGGEK